MSSTPTHPFRRTLIHAAVAILCMGCSDATSLPPAPEARLLHSAASLARGATDATITQLRSVTARYHDINVALAEGFVLLHGCETRPGEGTVGAVYVHFGRVTDGKLDPALPDALVYEPGKQGRLTLVGVEFAMPYTMWTEPTPPSLFGVTFQREDEFGVYALHAWVWRRNPDGLFAEGHPGVSCES